LDYQLVDDPQSLKNGNIETWFLLFATKKHWREDSDYAAIEEGMIWLFENYKKEGIKSLALPALGCGLGKLKWQDVGPMLCKYLKDFDITVQLYLPAEKEIEPQFLTKEFLLSKV
jgi:O-acetyl-ADP-ribose deacetylase (regulator of RNase III)